MTKYCVKLLLFHTPLQFVPRIRDLNLSVTCCWVKIRSP